MSNLCGGPRPSTYALANGLVDSHHKRTPLLQKSHNGSLPKKGALLLLARGLHAGTNPISSCSLHCRGGVGFDFLDLTMRSPILKPMVGLHHLGLLEREHAAVGVASPDVAFWVVAPAPWVQA